MKICIYRLQTQKKIILHKGNPNKAVDKELDNQLYNWIASNKSLGNPVSTWSIGIKIIKRNPQKVGIKPKSLLS